MPSGKHNLITAKYAGLIFSMLHVVQFNRILQYSIYSAHIMDLLMCPVCSIFECQYTSIVSIALPTIKRAIFTSSPKILPYLNIQYSSCIQHNMLEILASKTKFLTISALVFWHL